MIKTSKHLEKDDLYLKNKMLFYLSGKELITKKNIYLFLLFSLFNIYLLNRPLGIYQKISRAKKKASEF